MKSPCGTGRPSNGATPRYVVAVFAYTPGGGGGDVSAPAFREMMQYTLQHYRVPPSTKAAPKYTAFP